MPTLPPHRILEPGKRDPQGLPLSRLPDGLLLAQRYVVHFLEAGGMGAIYRATDQVEQGEVIIKEAYARDLNEHTLLTVALTQEREALIRLEHPGIVRSLDFFVEAGCCYMVLEYLPGRTLARQMNEGKGIDVVDAVHIALQVCDVLEHIHGKGLVYRDLKPENIMVSMGSDGHPEVKLIDFGTTRLFKPGQGRDTTALGTVGFAPPEQFGSGQTDARADIYSLGATLHYLLSHRSPEETPFAFPPLRSLNSKVNQALEAVIARAVRTQAHERFESVTEVRSALLEAMGKRCQPCGGLGRIRSRFCPQCGASLGNGVAPLLDSLPGPRPAAPLPKPSSNQAVKPSTPSQSSPQPAVPSPFAGTSTPSTIALPKTSVPTAAAPAALPDLLKPLPRPSLHGPAELLLPPPAHRGRTLQVNPNGRGAYTRIGDALAASRSGDCIEIAPGTYRENLRLGHSLCLRGAGPDKTRIVSLHDKPVVEINGAEQVWIEGLALEYLGKKASATVSASKAGLLLQNLWIGGATRSGLELGAQTRGEVRSSRVVGNQQSGILMHTGSQVSVLACYLRDNGRTGQHAGIEVRDQGKPRLEGNLISHNGVGIYIHDQATPLVRNNTLYQNGHSTECAALDIKDAAQPVLEGNLLQENLGGIMVGDKAAPKVAGNVLLRNGSGRRGYAVEVHGQATPRFEGNQFVDNAQGVLVRDEANAQFRLNRFLDNGLPGETYALEARGSAKVLLEENLLARNLGGIHITEAARARITDCLLIGHGRPRPLDAIEVSAGGQAIVSHNVLVQNAGAAVRFHGGGSGEVRHNIVVHNRQGLVAPERRGLLMSCGYNNVHDNGINYAGLTLPPTDLSCVPGFMDEGRYDFRLADDSPCCRAGRGGRALGPRIQAILEDATEALGQAPGNPATPSPPMKPLQAP